VINPDQIVEINNETNNESPSLVVISQQTIAEQTPKVVIIPNKNQTISKQPSKEPTVSVPEALFTD
jgi:hypothetical protein